MMKNVRNERRWFAIGDLQTTFARFMQVLARHELLRPDGRLANDVGLVTVGDYFDFGVVDDENAHVIGREGTRIVRWLAEHPPEQTVMLLGNHDMARVQELAYESEESFRAAQHLARQVVLRPELREKFLATHPRVPTPEVALRDFAAFMVEQRTLIQRLLMDGRVGLAVVAWRDGEDLLITHAGVTTVDLANADIAATTAPVIADALNAYLTVAVERAAPAWSVDAQEPLELAPLCVFGVSGHEGGGLIYHRPADPDRDGILDRHWEMNPERVRRFDPRTLVPDLRQACGHTSHARCVKEMPRWTDVPTANAAAGFIRSLSVDGEDVRYRVGAASHAKTSLLLIDGDINRVPVSAYDILPLDGVRL